MYRKDDNIIQSEIWKKILETGDRKELEFLLNLVLNDLESINVFLKKYDEMEEKITNESLKP